MNILIRHILASATAILLLASAAAAQTTGSLSGRIYDASNVPLQRAGVRLLGTTKGAITKHDGSFLITGIRAGDYDIQISAAGYPSRVVKARISANQITRIEEGFSPSYGFASYGEEVVFFNPARPVVYLPFHATIADATLSLKAYRLEGALETFLTDYPGVRINKPAAPEGTVRPDNRLAAIWEYNVPPGTSGGIEIPAPMREPGVYGVEVRDASQTLRKSYTVVVSEIGMIVKQTEEGVVAYLANAITGEREIGFPVTAAINGTPLGTFTSREDGTIAIPVGTKYPAARSIFFYGEHDGDILLVNSAYNGSALEDRSKLFLHTDKPVYRPEQSVNFRGIARKSDGSNGYATVSGGLAYAEMRDSRGSTVARDTAEISDLGTFAGSFQLGAEPPLGGYTIVATAAGLQGSSPFAVEEYKKPEFAVAVEMSSSSFKAGEAVKATLKARYFFGSPVSRAQVEYSIYRTPMPGSDAPAPERDAAQPEATTMVHTGKGELKEDGTYSISYPTSKEDRRNYTYVIRADVADNSRRTVSGNGSASVTHGDFAVKVETARNLYIAPDRMEATVRIRRFDGKRGEKIPFILSARRIRWQKLDDGTSRQQTEILRNIAGLTDEEGNGTVAIGTIAGGYLELRAEVASGADTSSGFRYVYSYDGVFDDWSLPGNEIQIVPEKEIYSPGERMRALVIPPMPGPDLFISAEGSRLHSYQVRPGWNGTIVDIAVGQSQTPNFFLAAATFCKGQHIAAMQEITVVPEHRRIDLRITTDKDSYKPGEKGRLMVSARDNRGRPMRGVDVALAAVDASIYEVAPDITPSMLRSFYPPLLNTVATQGQIGPDRAVISSWLNRYRTSIAAKAAPTTNATSVGRIQMVRDLDNANGFSIRGGRATESSVRADVVEADDAFAKDFSAVAEVTLAGSGADYDDMPSGTVTAVGHKSAPPVIRADFRDVMLWLPSVRTDSRGVAAVDLAFPDNLTTWRFAARGIDRNTSVGETSQDVVARKNLLVRMETPRFMTRGDELAIATTVHNYLPVAQTVRVEFAGKNLAVAAHSRTVTIPANGESRIDWQVTASTLDTARMAVRAVGDDESDAMETAVPVLPRGLHRRNSSTVRLARETSIGTMQFQIPQGSSTEGRSLNISLSPSVSSSMMGALDDLIGYPYGCAEQTMTRFLPTIVVANAVQQLDIPFDKARLAEMPKMVQAGLDRLYGFQHTDGGWGWWEHDETHPFMTAYIMYGLSVARTAGYKVDPARFDRGFASLRRQIQSREPAGNYGEARTTLDAPSEAYMLYVASSISREQPDKLYNQRTAALAATPGINDYAVALLALAASQQGDLKLASALSARLARTAHQTDSTVNWSGQTWDHSWQNDQVETSAYALKALLESSSQDEMIARSVDWLMSQREGNSWGNTRQTAMVLYTLIDYVRQMSLASSRYRIAVKVNGREVFNRELTRDELLGPDLRITLGAGDLRDGSNEITIEKDGDGALVASAVLTYYTEVSAIKAADNGFSVEREYHTLRKERSGEGYIYRKYPFTGTVASGEEMLVRIKVRSGMGREYFMLEDPLPAGCEVVGDVDGFIIEGESDYSGGASGGPGTWRWWYASREVRDEKIAFFATALEPGEYEFSYILRAQIPGIYNVMPSLGMLTYYPEVYGNSDPLRMTITEKRPARPEEELPSLR